MSILNYTVTPVDAPAHRLRDDALLVRDLVISPDAAPEWRLAIDDSAPETAHARRARWLGNL